MKYNLRTELDRQRLLRRVETLIKKEAIVELTDKSVRSLPQNAYLHLCLGVVAMETGNPLEYVKTEYYKRLVNPSLFLSTRFDQLIGKDIEVLRSSADLTTEEMTLSIDRFRKWASEQGWYIPSPEDKSILSMIEVEMARCGAFL